MAQSPNSYDTKGPIGWGIHMGIGRSIPIGEAATYFSSAPSLRGAVFAEFNRVRTELTLSGFHPSVTEPTYDSLVFSGTGTFTRLGYQIGLGYNLLQTGARHSVTPMLALGYGQATRTEPNFVRTRVGSVLLVTPQLIVRRSLMSSNSMLAHMELVAGCDVSCYPGLTGLRGSSMYLGIGVGWLIRETK